LSAGNCIIEKVVGIANLRFDIVDLAAINCQIVYESEGKAVLLLTQEV
jgi:hypothetical protein